MDALLADAPALPVIEDRYRLLIQAQFPELGNFQIEEIATQMEEPEHDLDIEHFHDQVALHCHQGHPLDVAMELAWREHMVTVHAPPGCLLARVQVTMPTPRRIRLTFRNSPA